MAESSRSCELMFEKIFEKHVSYKHLPSREAEAAKLEFSNFLLTTVEEKKDIFVKFNKETDRVNAFIRQFLLDTNKFIMLQKVLKMLMILSHGQATVEGGFSVNGKFFIENLDTGRLIARRHIHDHMGSYDLEAHYLDVTREFLDSVSSARKSYFQS